MLFIPVYVRKKRFIMLPLVHSTLPVNHNSIMNFSALAEKAAEFPVYFFEGLLAPAFGAQIFTDCFGIDHSWSELGWGL